MTQQQDAIEFFEPLLADRQKSLGSEHPNTLLTRNNLADAPIAITLAATRPPTDDSGFACDSAACGRQARADPQIRSRRGDRLLPPPRRQLRPSGFRCVAGLPGRQVALHQFTLIDEPGQQRIQRVARNA